MKLEQVLTVNWVGDCITEDTGSGEMQFLGREELTDSHQILLNLWTSCNDVVKQVDDRFTAYAFTRKNRPAVEIEVKAWAETEARLKQLDELFEKYGFTRQEPIGQPYDLVREGKVEKRLYTYALEATEMTAMQLMASVSFLDKAIRDAGLDEHRVQLFKEVVNEDE